MSFKVTDSYSQVLENFLRPVKNSYLIFNIRAIKFIIFLQDTDTQIDNIYVQMHTNTNMCIHRYKFAEYIYPYMYTNTHTHTYKINFSKSTSCPNLQNKYLTSNLKGN
jgi:hypothetical protein